MKSISAQRQSGAVSLFVVIFAMLIITVITVGFLRLMMADQRQASDNDLSQSAYDSAQAGVEDAKRALLRYQEVCTTQSAATCSALSEKFTPQVGEPQCNTALLDGGVVNSNDVSSSPNGTGEVSVQQSVNGSDTALNQAYTCVKVYLTTDDYVGNLKPGESQLVPLVGKDNYDTVTVRWYSRDDVSDTNGNVTLPGVSATHPLPLQSSWNANTPSLMRAQLIQFGSSFKMSDFDAVNAAGESNGNTVFLYPTSGVGATTAAFTALNSRTQSVGTDPSPAAAIDTPHPVKCASTTSAGGYACSMSLTMPTPIGGGSRTAFLRLTPFYNGTHFQVVLSNGTPSATGNNIVKFKDVQPMIDSTGRANDIFRRVQSRVDLYNTDFPYPDATIDVTNNFCKNFGVSDTTSTYDTSINACKP